MGTAETGNDTDFGDSIAVDTSGNVYVAGISDASWGSPVNAHIEGQEAFVVKLNASGVLQWNTFAGAAGNDAGKGISLDSAGDIYFTGFSE